MNHSEKKCNSPMQSAVVNRRTPLLRKKIAELICVALLGGVATFSTQLVFAATVAAKVAAPAKSSVTPLPKGVTQLSTVEGITEYRLANGLKVLLMPDNSKPTVAVNVTYLVGSRFENYGETGMAHLLEHLMFKGTPKNAKITQEFNKRGMRINGTTSLDRTNYFELFQASEDNLKWALQLEADRMVHSNIAKKDLDTEMTVVRNEYEMRENSPGEVLRNRLQSAAYDWHNYGNALIGNRSDIENVKIENLQAFYHMYYQPDNAVLMVSGKFDASKTLALIAADFGVIAKPKRQMPVFWTVEPMQDGERTVEVRRKGDIQLVMLAYKKPAVIHADNNALDLAAQILTDAPNGRLHKQLVETGKALEVFSTSIGGTDPGLKIIGAVVKKGESIQAAKDALLAGIEDFKLHPPTKDEIERAQRDQVNAYEKLLNNHESIGVGISDYIALGDWRYVFKERDEIAKVTAEQVNAVIKHYFTRDNRTVGMFIPEDEPQRAEIPAAPTIADVMKDFKTKETTLTAEEFDPSPANIDKRSVLSKIGGLEVALLPKQTRGETVNVSLSLHFGDEQSFMGKKAASIAASNLLLAGTSKYSRAQLADEMAKLKISGDAYHFQTTKDNLVPALALMSHVLREANFPESEFKLFQQQAAAAIDAGRNEPGNVAGNALAIHFNQYPKDDIRAAETLDESKAGFLALTVDQVRAFHKQFYGASNGELSIVGAMDVDAVKAAVEQDFANWPSVAPYARLVNLTGEIPAERKAFNTPDKENGFYYSRMNLALKETDADYVALRVADFMFGHGSGGGMNSRLMNRIRQKDGLSYMNQSDLNAGQFEADGTFEIIAIAAPQNLAKLEAAIREELERATKDGFTAEELAKAKTGMLQARQQERSNDASVAGVWTNNLYLHRTWAWNQSIDDKIKALTLDQVNAAFKKYIVPSKMSVFVAGDEAKMGGKAK